MDYSLIEVPGIGGESYIQMHVSNRCNLSCACCSHYTNIRQGGLISKAMAVEWMRPWSRRVVPQKFFLMGGEPTMNPELADITLEACRLWNRSRVAIVTNGFFLKNHPTLPKIMAENNVELEISIKGDKEPYLTALNRIRELVQEWQSEYRFDVLWRDDYKNWVKMYHEEGGRLLPFNLGDSELSYKNCRGKICRVLHEGKLWKCPNLAFLRLRMLGPEWDDFVAYRPLEPDCSTEALVQFLKDEAIDECRMCATSFERIENDPFGGRRRISMI